MFADSLLVISNLEWSSTTWVLEAIGNKILALYVDCNSDSDKDSHQQHINMCYSDLMQMKGGKRDENEMKEIAES